MSDQDDFESRHNVVLLASRSALAERTATARNFETVIRERIARIGQLEVAQAARIDKTKLNRVVSGSAPAGICIYELYDFFAAIGMGVIECGADDEIVSLPKSELDALRTLARKGLSETT